MILFIDTETTGLPENWKAPASDTGNWPRMVQIAWMLADTTGKEIAAANRIIKPEGFSIPADASRIHGITTALANQTGIALIEALGEFSEIMQQAGLVVAHNIAFDEKVIGAEYIRSGKTDLMSAARKLCLMKAATEYCRLPGKYGYKWPSLKEVHTVLFDQSPENLHNADSDMRICARCYYELRKRQVIEET